MHSPLWKAFGKIPQSTANSAFAPTFTQKRSRPFSGTLIIFWACRDPELYKIAKALDSQKNPPEDSRVQVCAKPCTPLFGKPLESYHEVRPIGGVHVTQVSLIITHEYA